MILEKLVQHYESLVNDGLRDIAPLGYSVAKVSFAITLSEQGTVMNLLDLRGEDRGKSIPRLMIVPLQETRSAGKTPYFLCDKSKYVFGFDENDEEKGQVDEYPEHFAEFRKMQLKILEGINDIEAQAVVNFVNSWDPQKIGDIPVIFERLKDIAAASALVFRMEGQRGFIHDNVRIKQAWDEALSSIVENTWDLISSSQGNSYTAQCLITGETTSIAKIHQSIKGVVGAQPSGAAIVSFNIPSFVSYNKEQSYNAPIGRTTMLKYTTALNYLLAGANKIRLGDTTVVYWAERLSPHEEDFLKLFLDPPFMEDKDEEKQEKGSLDTVTEIEREVAAILNAIKHGKKAKDMLSHPDLAFYILRLAPNNSRLSIRFWMVDSFGDLIEKITRHYLDMDIVKPPNAFMAVPLWVLLREIAVLAKKGEKPKTPNTMIASLNNSVLRGTSYPEAMLPAMIGRIRADKKINYQRVGFIKAYLIRNHKCNEEEEVITVSLNLNNKTPAYLLGRLFSLLEKAQTDAAESKLNATIKDRYFSSASATPAIVFPQLLRLSQHHIRKLKFGRKADEDIQRVIDDLNEFPARLSLKDQGVFILGYYHQKQANYSVKPKEPSEENPEESNNGNN